MATERNPFEPIPEQQTPNIISLTERRQEGPTFEVEPDGGLTVDFSTEEEFLNALCRGSLETSLS